MNHSMLTGLHTDFSWLLLCKRLPDFLWTLTPFYMGSITIIFPSVEVIRQAEGGGLCVVILGSGWPQTYPPQCIIILSTFPCPWDVFIPGLGSGALLPLRWDRMLVSALPFLLFLSHPPPPLPLSVASSKDALSISSTPGVKLVEEKGGGKEGGWRGREEVTGGREKKQRREGSTWLEGRKIISAGAALFKVKAWFAFQKRRPAVLPPQGCHWTNQHVI